MSYVTRYQRNLNATFLHIFVLLSFVGVLTHASSRKLLKLSKEHLRLLRMQGPRSIRLPRPATRLRCLRSLVKIPRTSCSQVMLLRIRIPCWDSSDLMTKCIAGGRSRQGARSCISVPTIMLFPSPWGRILPASGTSTPQRARTRFLRAELARMSWPPSPPALPLPMRRINTSASPRW